MIELILSGIGISLLVLYFLSYGDVAMVLNIHRIGIAIFHERRWVHFYPGIIAGLTSIGISIFNQVGLLTIQRIYLMLFGFITFNEIFGFPGIFKPIFYPDFVKTDETPEAVESYLQEEVIAVTMGQKVRIYPVQPLRMNHIVNDTFEGKKIVVTHCALCKTSIVYSREVIGREIEITPTTSTNESNLVMKDNEGNFWQQISGEGLGPKNKGETLEFITSQVITQDRITELIDEGYDVEIMGYSHTGRRKAAATPFNALMKIVDNPEKKVLFPVSFWDERLPRKTNVMAFHINDQAYAIDISSIDNIDQEIELNGTLYSIVIDHSRGYYQVKNLSNNRQIYVIFPVYWFAWSTRYRNTAIIPLSNKPLIETVIS